MKQKIAGRVRFRCDKCRSKAMGLVASTHGLEYVGLEGPDKNQLVVVGDGVDAANLTICLRKKMGNAELLKVEAVDSAGKKPAAETTVAAPYRQQWWYPYPGYYSRSAVVYPYPDGHR